MWRCGCNGGDSEPHRPLTIADMRGEQPGPQATDFNLLVLSQSHPLRPRGAPSCRHGFRYRRGRYQAFVGALPISTSHLQAPLQCGGRGVYLTTVSDWKSF